MLRSSKRASKRGPKRFSKKLAAMGEALAEETTIRITDLARGGAGVARDSKGRVVFVPLTAPGDLVRVQISGAEKNYAQGELIELLEMSPMRQTPPCPIFGICGGCQWQHLPYHVQWETKVRGVRHALARVKVEAPADVDLLPAEQIWEYRNRVQLRGDKDGMGFFRPQSREIVPAKRCYIARPEINKIWDETQKEGARLNKPYKVEIEVLPDGSIRKTWNSKHSSGGFRQVHDEQNEKLKQWVANHIRGSSILYDLYGGSGNLSLTLAAQMREVHCIDLGAPRARTPGLSEHFYFHQESVLKWLLNQTQVKEGMAGSEIASFASAIIDPPREGLAEDFREIAAALEKLGVNEIVFVGCDPDSFARDVSRWIKCGWSLGNLMILDLFPQTYHVESVALLTRRFV